MTSPDSGALGFRIAEALRTALAPIEGPATPPRLRAAIHHAVFPGGGRVRPRLLLAVSAACGDASPRVSDRFAAALELLHCASLVHDDLPCFDGAELRRGRATVHRAFSEPLAVLTGDALIVTAHSSLVADPDTAMDPLVLTQGLRILGEAAGPCGGMAAGQAWESEPDRDIEIYHRAKTGRMFEAAVRLGALTGGGDPAAWEPVGRAVGEAYQIADDLADLRGDPEALGKPTGRDVARGQPNIAVHRGVRTSIDRLVHLSRAAAEAVPRGPGARQVRELIEATVTRLLPSPRSGHGEHRRAPVPRS